MSVNWACLSKNEKAFFANSSILLSHVANLKIGGVAEETWQPMVSLHFLITSRGFPCGRKISREFNFAD